MNNIRSILFPSNSDKDKAFFMPPQLATWHAVTSSGSNRTPSISSTTNLTAKYGAEHEKALKAFLNHYERDVKVAIERTFNINIVERYIKQLYILHKKLHPRDQADENVQKIILAANNCVVNRGMPIPPDKLPQVDLHIKIAALSIKDPLSTAPDVVQQKKIAVAIADIFSKCVVIRPYPYMKPQEDAFLEEMKALINMYNPQVQALLLNAVDSEIPGQDTCFFNTIKSKLLIYQAPTGEPINAASASISFGDSNSHFDTDSKTNNIRKRSRHDSTDEEGNQFKKRNNSPVMIDNNTLTSQISNLSLEDRFL